MSSSLGLDLARYRAALASAFPLADTVSAELAWLPGSVPVLAEELAKVPDPRRAAGRRFDLVFLLSVVAMATLAGARSISGILRWAAKTDPAVLTALARGGPCRLPAYSTMARLLARLDGDAVDDALARYTAAGPGPTRPAARHQHPGR
jgi:hypothetical protein